MALYYIKGTSNSGSTFGQTGYFYPLYLTQAEALAVSTDDPQAAHTHTFAEAPEITFYMPSAPMNHAVANAPTGLFNGEVYVSYLNPVDEANVLEFGEGVVESDTFNTWRKKTNDVGREAISVRAEHNKLQIDFNRLIDVTSGDVTNAIVVGSNGKLYVESNEFKFDKSIDLHTAGATLKASELNVPTGLTTLSGQTYQWPNTPGVAGQSLLYAGSNQLSWGAPTSSENRVETFLIEDPNPIGLILQWAKELAPDKWLLCDGEAVSRSTYSELFGEIGTTYGAGDGSTTFNVPDLRARVPIGKGTNTDANNLSAAFNTLGASTYTSESATLSGEFKHTLTIDKIPSHRHVGSFAEASSVFTGRWGYMAVSAGQGSYGAIDNDNDRYGYTKYTGGDGSTVSYSRDGTNQDVPSTNSHNVVQPFIILNYIIKAQSSTIVQQNLKPEDGILISSDGGATYSASANNLLQSGADNRIKMDVNTTDDFKFTGNTLELKTRPLSIDYRLIRGTVRLNTNRKLENANFEDGYIDTNSLAKSVTNVDGTGAIAADNIYDSDFSDPTTGEFNYNNVLPMVFPANIEKTIITAKYNWSPDSTLEEMQFLDIVIDWANNTIMGTSITNYEKFEDHFLPKQTIQSSSTAYAWTALSGTNHDNNIKIIIEGSTKTISGFPWPYNENYDMQTAQIKIENHIRG
jgi:microcystin-dependent protein